MSKIFKIHISKKLSDYNNNFLDIPINLIYSTSDSITYNYISGKLYNFNSKMNSQKSKKMKSRFLKQPSN